MTKNKIKEIICENKTEVSQKTVLSIMKLCCYTLTGMDSLAKDEESEIMLADIIASAVSGKINTDSLYELLVKYQEANSIGEQMDVPEIDIPKDWK